MAMKGKNKEFNEAQTPTGSLPEYLASYDSLAQHFRAQFDGLATNEKGDKFATFGCRVIPQTEIGKEYNPPVLREKKTHDEGVDITASGKDGCSILYIQSRLWLDKAETLDSVISKFQNYWNTYHTEKAGSRFLFVLDEQPINFMLITLSRLDNIIKSYEKRSFASKEFYDKLKADKRIHFIDGSQILTILRGAYGKITELPTNLTLNLETEFINKDNVYIGIVSSKELRDLYTQFGDALFFENIRDFLGLSEFREKVGRTSPNQEIAKTILNHPETMLQKNNGIVFRAQKVEVGESPRQLILTRGSIVNGCQTTMCMVDSTVDQSFVLVKIVETEDSWAIAKAANFQNSIDFIDLELARNMRPQLAKRAAAFTGIRLIDGERSALQLLDDIYDRKIIYDETRLFYIGLFSKTPNNIFASNYTELMHDLIERFYKEDSYGEKTFQTLFALQAASQEGVKSAEERFIHPQYADLFKRLYSDNSLTYRCFIGILALCGAININIADRAPDPTAEYGRMVDFFSKALSLLENRKERFLRYYIMAVKTWMQEATPAEQEESEIRRDLYIKSKRFPFMGMYTKLCIEADMDTWLKEEEEAFQEKTKQGK
jgi:hypothetical protein